MSGSSPGFAVKGDCRNKLLETSSDNPDHERQPKVADPDE